MDKNELIYKFYIICNSLKTMVSTNKSTEGRAESIADEIFNAEMIAISNYYNNQEQYKDVDLLKALAMLIVYKLDDEDVDSRAILEAMAQLQLYYELEGLYTNLVFAESKEAKFCHSCMNLADNIDEVDKEEYKFISITNKLKTLVRQGWIDWKVSAPRLESVSEHIFSTQILAIALYSENVDYYSNVNIYRVLLMLAIHELGETVIGDLTQFQISKDEKKKLEHAAVHELLKDIPGGEELETLFLEFDERQTPDALFAHFCDKLDCDTQSTVYGNKGYVDLSDQEDNKTFHNERVQRLLSELHTFGGMWVSFGQEVYGYDEPCMDYSRYLLKIVDEPIKKRKIQ